MKLFNFPRIIENTHFKLSTENSTFLVEIYPFTKADWWTGRHDEVIVAPCLAPRHKSCTNATGVIAPANRKPHLPSACVDLRLHIASAKTRLAAWRDAWRICGPVIYEGRMWPIYRPSRKSSPLNHSIVESC